MTQHGYANEWPDQFGLENSILLDECNKARCNWYQHPSNNCPDNLSKDQPNTCDNIEDCTGTCLEVQCRCVEWYYQVAMVGSGQKLAVRNDNRDHLGEGKYEPKTAEAMLAKLSPEMVEIFQ